MKELSLEKFSMSNLNDDIQSGRSRTIIISAKRCQGRKTLITDILCSLKNVPVIVMTSDPSYFQKHINNDCLYSGFREDVLERILDRQKQMATKRSICLVLDNLVSDRKMLSCNTMKDILVNGCRYSITLIMTVQDPSTINQAFRVNVDYFFTFGIKNLLNHPRLHERMFSIFKKESYFKEILDSVTEDYGLLVADCTSQSDKIQDHVFWYKATPNQTVSGLLNYWDIDE